MRRRIFDCEDHVHFVTFSCYRRRRLLDEDRAKGIVIHFLSSQLSRQEGECLGFIIMPDHVHALVRFGEKGKLSIFMNQWKRLSSMRLKHFYKQLPPSYSEACGLEGPMCRPTYYCFNVYSEKKLREKLDYMHINPVRAGLVQHPQDWLYGSARWYLSGKSVGVPISRPV